jgi:hypothetical protein
MHYKNVLYYSIFFKCQPNASQNLELPDSSSGSQDNLYHQHHCPEETCCLIITAKVGEQNVYAVLSS